MTARFGIVVEIHPEDHSADLVMSNGARLTGVQIMTGNGSTRSGSVDLPVVKPVGNKWDITKASGQDLKAVVIFVEGCPVITGFLFPQVNQMLLKDGASRRYRHQSDVETLIDGQGNIQITHPGGTFIRIGETPEADPLTGRFADASTTDRNVARPVHVRIAMAGGTAVLTIAPDGAVSLVAASVLLDTPQVHCTGNVLVDGDVVASGVSLVHHTHGGVRGGSDTSGAPS